MRGVLLGRAVLPVRPRRAAGEHPRPAWHLVLVSVLPGMRILGSVRAGQGERCRVLDVSTSRFAIPAS